MMIIMQPGATKEHVNNVIKSIKKYELSAHTIVGVEHTVIGVVGENHGVPTSVFESLPFVQSVHLIRYINHIYYLF